MLYLSKPGFFSRPKLFLPKAKTKVFFLKTKFFFKTKTETFHAADFLTYLGQSLI